MYKCTKYIKRLFYIADKKQMSNDPRGVLLRVTVILITNKLMFLNSMWFNTFDQYLCMQTFSLGLQSPLPHGKSYATLVNGEFRWKVVTKKCTPRKKLKKKKKNLKRVNHEKGTIENFGKYLLSSGGIVTVWKN